MTRSTAAHPQMSVEDFEELAKAAPEGYGSNSSTAGSTPRTASASRTSKNWNAGRRRPSDSNTHTGN